MSGNNPPVVFGFRAYPEGFSYVCLAGTQKNPTLISNARLTFPSGQRGAEALCWVRKQICELLQPFSVVAACVKTIEPMAMRKSKDRLFVEGVILEVVFSNKAIVCQHRIKSQLRRDIDSFSGAAKYLPKVLSESPTLKELDVLHYQEAALAAVSALPVV